MNSPPSSTAATSPAEKPDFNLAFGQAKYIGALWMAYLARQHPDRRFITVSPGATTGTQAANGLAATAAYSGQVRHARPGDLPQT